MHRREILAGLSAGALGAFVPLSSVAREGRRATGYLRTNWSRDPFSHGSYSFIAQGASRADVHRVAAPVGEALHFAGEALHPRYNGTVHAAYESGVLAAAAVAATDARRVLIIGAGISGLAAARQLVSDGREVVVVEGRNRIGGRIWTDRSLGTPLDLGASWIHGATGNPIAKLAAEHDIRTVKTDETFAFRDGRGQEMPESDIPDWLTEVSEIEQVFGASSAELNLAAYGETDGYQGAELVFPGGYDQIFAGMSGVDVRLNEPVVAISYGSDGVTANTSLGTHQADAVIVTVPLGVLKAKTITFEPPLPQPKRDAIARLGMGVLDKLYLQFDEVFWDRRATWLLTPETGLARGQFNQWFNMAKYVGEPVLLGFNGAASARALSSLSDDEMVKRALGVLTQIYPT